ncbi:proline-rich protein 4-like [Canna indica]|uniref:Proline-rich protein 4-like n=1 Tax=Canna indica TaxID=4628 RepID=A0AAQ3KET4_9LILI|nr:proline-rich protein 4-like [Canna indica]
MGTLLRSILFSLYAVLVMIQVSNAASQSEAFLSVVGNTECLDCAQKSIKTENAVKGLRVAINCKVSSEQYETKAIGELDNKGEFNVKLPRELLNDNGELKHECFAQLHSKSNKPCPSKNGLVPSKLVLKSKDAESGQHTFSAASGKLSFSSATCASATFLPCPPLSWKKKFPKFHIPHFKPHYHPHPEYHSPPTYKPAPSHGYYNPPAPVYKPPTPSGGYYQPPAPVHKPPSGGGYYNPPAAPTYKPSPVHYHDHDHYQPISKKPMPSYHHGHDHPGYPPHRKL